MSEGISGSGSADRCTLCRTVIAPTSLKRVVNGESYHSGCWDRKVRQEAEKKKLASP
jgi:hypothetical protein